MNPLHVWTPPQQVRGIWSAYSIELELHLSAFFVSDKGFSVIYALRPQKFAEKP